MIAVLGQFCGSHLPWGTKGDDPLFINSCDKSLEFLSFNFSQPAVPVATLFSLLGQQQLRLVEIQSCTVPGIPSSVEIAVITAECKALSECTAARHRSTT